jgi:hypothetical protein
MLDQWKTRWIIFVLVWAMILICVVFSSGSSVDTIQYLACSTVSEIDVVFWIRLFTGKSNHSTYLIYTTFNFVNNTVYISFHSGLMRNVVTAFVQHRILGEYITWYWIVMLCDCSASWSC